VCIYSGHTHICPLQSHTHRHEALFARRARVPRRLHPSLASWSKTVSTHRLPQSSHSFKQARKDSHHSHVCPSVNFAEMPTDRDTRIKQPVCHKLALAPMHDPPIHPNPVRNRNLHSISLRRKCHPKLERRKREGYSCQRCEQFTRNARPCR
jgi:hypothetical protein